jgi:hypothetical protein
VLCGNGTKHILLPEKANVQEKGLSHLNAWDDIHRNNVLPIYKTEYFYQLLDTCFAMVDWPLPLPRSSCISTNFCIFPSICNFLKINLSNR